MKLKEKIDLASFLEAVKKCKDEVYFETKEGDSLALHSALCQYIFCTLTNKPEILSNAEIRLINLEDLGYLVDYLEEI